MKAIDFFHHLHYDPESVFKDAPGIVLRKFKTQMRYQPVVILNLHKIAQKLDVNACRGVSCSVFSNYAPFI